MFGSNGVDGKMPVRFDNIIGVQVICGLVDERGTNVHVVTPLVFATGHCDIPMIVVRHRLRTSPSRDAHEVVIAELHIDNTESGRLCV
jgi:hypothetical protein